MAPPTDPRLDWSLLRTFLAVLDAGSLSGGARRLGVPQPTMSRRIASLESQLGVPLFERTGRGVAPTAAALEIAEAARRMEAGADDLLRRLARRGASASGTVRVTASQAVAAWLLPPVIARLQAGEPGIAIELVASNALSNLLRREADIAVRMVRPAQSSLIARRLGEVAIVACAHRDYLARAGTPRTPADLMRHRLVGYDRDDLLLRGFAAFGLPITRDRFAVRTDDHVAYGQLVGAGAGIGFVARYALRHWPGVVAVLPELRVPPLPCWLAVHREIRGSGPVRRVFDALAGALPAALAG